MCPDHDGWAGQSPYYIRDCPGHPSVPCHYLTWAIFLSGSLLAGAETTRLDVPGLSRRLLEPWAEWTDQEGLSAVIREHLGAPVAGRFSYRPGPVAGCVTSAMGLVGRGGDSR